ncbi:MAG: transposase [Desulfitobacteriaceae bacterium]
MSKSKWPQVEENLMLVEKWMRDGLTEEQICKNLGISVYTLNVFKKKHPELAKALKKGREIAITEVENALFRRALGYTYDETKVSIRMVDGKEVKFTEKTTKHLAPDVAACSILLKNKDKERGWSDNPQKIELEKLMFEHRKKIEEAQVFGDDDLRN